MTSLPAFQFCRALYLTREAPDVSPFSLYIESQASLAVSFIVDVFFSKQR